MSFIDHEYAFAKDKRSRRLMDLDPLLQDAPIALRAGLPERSRRQDIDDETERLGTLRGLLPIDVEVTFTLRSRGRVPSVTTTELRIGMSEAAG